MGGLKNGPHANREGLSASIAFPETWASRFTRQSANSLNLTTMRANRAIRPQASFDISEGSIFVMEAVSIENGIGHGFLQ